jgi:hypothetical protein
MRKLPLLTLALLSTSCQPEPVWTAESLRQGPAPPPTCSPKSPVPGSCAARCGTYVTQYQKLGGDCGTMPEQTAKLDGDPKQAPHPCTGYFSASPNACETTFDIRCPTRDDSGTTLASTERGTLTWSAEASHAQGELELWVTTASGEPRCHGTYQVSVARR